MKKKILATCSLCVFLFCLTESYLSGTQIILAASVSEQNVTVEEKNSLSENNFSDDSLSGERGLLSETDVSCESAYPYDIEPIGNFTLDDRSYITEYNGDNTEIVLPENIRGIAQGAFEDSNIEKIKQYDRNTNIVIEGQAFKNCEKLKEVILNCSNIGEEAFYNCHELSRYNQIGFGIVCDIVSVGDRAFYNCRNLGFSAKKCAISYCGIRRIGEEAFYGCEKVTDISLVLCNEIGDRAFKNSGIQSLKLYMDDFVNCYGTAGYLFIGAEAFANCGNLAEFTLIMSNPDSEKVQLVINERAFYNCNNLSKAEIPAAKYIGEYAFYNCATLKSIMLPDELEKIEGYACGYNSVKGEICRVEDFSIQANPKTAGIIYAINNGFTKHEKHSYKLVSSEEPDCESEGMKEYECEICNDIYMEFIPRLSHDYSVCTVVKKGNKLSEGLVYYRCKFCGEYLEVSTPKDDAVGTRFRKGDFTYQITSLTKRTAKVIKYHGDKDRIKIAATVKHNTNTFTVTEFSPYLLEDQKNLRKFTVGKNIEKIPANAFRNNKKLKQLEICSTNLKSIGKNAFKSLNKKSCIIFPKSKKIVYQNMISGQKMAARIKWK